MFAQGTASQSNTTSSSSSTMISTPNGNSGNHKRHALMVTANKHDIMNKQDNRWSNGLPNVIMDDIWSYLSPKQLLQNIERTCRTWNHLSHRLGIGWHTLDLGLGGRQPMIRWTVLQSLLNTRIFRR